MKREPPIACDNPRALASDVVAARWEMGDEARLACRPIVHSHASLTFHVSGGARVEQRGEWSVREGDVLIVPAGAPHRTLARSKSWGWGVSFSMTSFGGDEATLLAPIERVRDGATPVVAIPSSRHGFLETVFHELERVGAAHDASRAIVRRSLLALVLSEIGDASHTSFARDDGANALVAESLRFIERNCLRRLTLDDIAEAVRRSPAHVTSTLTKMTGRSAGEWIVSYRLAEARRLLIASDEGIEAVADRIGYADATHFVRMFRRTHGVTPAAWRRAIRRRSS